MYHQWDGGKAAFRFWSRFHQNCGCHGNRKLPLTYDGEDDVSRLMASVLIRSSSNLQVTRMGIKYQTSSNFGQIEPLTSELGALERLKHFPQTYNGKMVSRNISHKLIMGKWCLEASIIFDRIFVKLAGN